MKTFDQIKQQLLALTQEYAQRIDAIQMDTHHKNEPVEKDFAEQATQSENNDVLNALDNEAQEMVLQIDNALSAIKNGSYGICSSCKIEIPLDRLNAAPFANLCIKCAENTDHG